MRRSSLRRDRVMTPSFSAAVAAASLITVPAHATAPARVPDPSPVAAPSIVVADPHALDAAIVPLPRQPVAQHTAPRRSQRIDAPTRVGRLAEKPTHRARRYGVAAGGLTLLGGALFFASSRLPGRVTSVPSPLARASQSLASVSPAPAALPAAAVAAPARLATARADSLRIASVKARAAASIPQWPQPDALVEQRSAVPVMALVPNIGTLVIPETRAPNVDSVLRAATPRRDASSDQIGTSGRLTTPVLGDDRSETSPQLIGVVPQPRFPEALRAQRIEGAVVVQFLVGVDGSVDPSSMKVVRSPHALFTEAVRNVLPKLHFQPGRAADAKPHAEWVQYSVQFSATK